MIKLKREHFFNWLIIAIVFIGLIYISFFNYLLFHSFAEVFSITIAFVIFMLAWNSDKYMENKYLILIGVSYLFIGGLDLLHTLSYKGLTIFNDYDYYANQLWIATRYLESLSLLFAFLSIGKKFFLSKYYIFIIYSIITFFVIYTIFINKVFPICFIDGKGLTTFKIYSEYIIIFILIISMLVAIKKRQYMDSYVFKYFVASISTTILSEFMFSLYISNYGLSNMLGHYLKIISYYFIYKSVVVTYITQPYDLIFRELKNKELELSEQSITDSMTKFINRRATYSILDKLISNSTRSNDPLSVCYIDLDGLKNINDTYGHKNGDIYIMGFVNTIREFIRDGDYGCRLGGDEFLFIFNKCSKNQVIKIIERVETLLEDKFKSKEIIFPIHFSYGIVESSPDLDSTKLIELSDKEMYLNKKSKK